MLIDYLPEVLGHNTVFIDSDTGVSYSINWDTLQSIQIGVPEK